MIYIIAALYIFEGVTVIRALFLIILSLIKNYELFEDNLKTFLIIAAVPLLGTILPLLASIFSYKEGIYYSLFFALFGLLGCSMLLVMSKPSLEFDHEGFSYGHILGFRIKRRYEDITRIKQYPDRAIIYMGKRSIKLYMKSEEDMKFFNYAKRQYNMLNGRINDKRQ